MAGEFKVELGRATLAGFHPKKATRTLRGEEHDPPKMVLIVEVDLEEIEPHMRDLIGVYRFGGRLGQGDGPGIALDFPTRAEQRRLWEQETAQAQAGDARNGAAGDRATAGTTPIGAGRTKAAEKEKVEA
jgi:hypothetical protein